MSIAIDDAVLQPATASSRSGRVLRRTPSSEPRAISGGARVDAVEVAAWFSGVLVLDDVSLSMSPGTVTALIGPSGCGKSTFLRILNRMHESVRGAELAGEVYLNGEDIYAPGVRVTDTRRRVGMVFQKPNPFPAMSIADNVTAGLKLTNVKISRGDRGELVESCLRRAGLWSGGEGPARPARRRLVRWPATAALHRPRPRGRAAGAADGRAVLGARPDVDSLDRGDDRRAPFRGDDGDRHTQHATGSPGVPTRGVLPCRAGNPGGIVEQGPTEQLFDNPQDPRTADYVNGRFG